MLLDIKVKRMPSVTSICNIALARLGANRILNIDDDTTEARLCKAVYDNLRDAVLEEHQWSFAIGRYQLPIASGSMVGGQYANRFLIPVNVINIIRAGSNSDDRVVNTDSWRIEGEYIVSNAGTMYIKTIDKIIDPKMYSPMFTQALAIRIAAEIAWAITQSANIATGLLQEYARLMSLAAQKDGQQGTTQTIRSGRYRQVRSAGAGGYIGPYV